MATYTIKDVKVTDFKDPHGNSWINVAFEEYGEPVVMVVKDPSKVMLGNKYDGEIKQVQKKSGNGTYNRFFRDKPQDQQGGYSSGSNQRGGTKREYQPRDDQSIHAQFAIREANLQVVNGIINADELEERARDFYDMIERVKHHDKPEEDKRLTDEQKQVASVVPDADKMVELSEIPF